MTEVNTYCLDLMRIRLQGMQCCKGNICNCVFLVGTLNLSRRYFSTRWTNPAFTIGGHIVHYGHKKISVLQTLSRERHVLINESQYVFYATFLLAKLPFSQDAALREIPSLFFSHSFCTRHRFVFSVTSSRQISRKTISNLAKKY